jgi:hypothetical protein
MNRAGNIAIKLKMLTPSHKIRTLHPVNCVIMPPLVLLKVTLFTIKHVGVWFSEVFATRHEFVWWNDKK